MRKPAERETPSQKQTRGERNRPPSSQINRCIALPAGPFRAVQKGEQIKAVSAARTTFRPRQS